MQADVAVGVELAFVAEDADFALADLDDLALAVFKLGCLSDKLFGHGRTPLLNFFDDLNSQPCKQDQRYFDFS
jgi:hypothetical protein